MLRASPARGGAAKRMKAERALRCLTRTLDMYLSGRSVSVNAPRMSQPLGSRYRYSQPAQVEWQIESHDPTAIGVAVLVENFAHELLACADNIVVLLCPVTDC